MSESPRIFLRPVRPEDTDFLAAVYASTRMDELSVTPWSDREKATFCRSQFEAQTSHYRKHYPSAEYHVIVVDDTDAGRLYVDRWAREIRIMDIALLPAHRGRGTGSHLLAALREEARVSRRALSIHVERTNPAMTLYHRLGFVMKEDKGVYLLMEWTAC